MRNELLYVSHPLPPFAHLGCTRLVRHVCSRSHCIATPPRRGWFAARINKIVATPRETTSSYNKTEKESRGWLETEIKRDKKTGDKGWWTWSTVIEHKSSLRRPPAIGIFFIEPRVNIYLVHVLATPTRCHDNCAAESWTVLIASRRCSRSQGKERERERDACDVTRAEFLARLPVYVLPRATNIFSGICPYRWHFPSLPAS